MIPFGLAMFLAFIAWPFIRQRDPTIADAFYKMKLDYQEVKGKHKTLAFVSSKIQPLFGEGLVMKVDKQLQLAGRPWGIKGSDLLAIQVIIAIGLILLSFMASNTPGAMIALALLSLFMPYRLIRTRMVKRRMEASMAIRFLKRRFAMNLKTNVPAIDALHEMAKMAPGEFGVTFRYHMSQLGSKSVREVMKELQEEYMVRELDQFCEAIKMADQKTLDILIDNIDRQIREENARMDEFVEKHSNAAKIKSMGVMTIAFVYTLGIAIYFAYVYVHNAFMAGHNFLGL